MQKRIYTVLFFCLVCLASSWGQNTVSGIVSASETGEPLIGANILVKGTVVGTVTDLDGNFELKTNQSLPYTLVVSYTGFEKQEVEINEANATLNVAMEVASVLGNEIVVSASRVEENILQSPVTIEKLDAIAIRESSSGDYYDEIVKLKGVHSNQASLTFNTINTRGFATAGNTRFVQLMDGMDNAAPLLNFPTGNVVGISELDIENVELVPGAASALYGPNAFNGILMMNSKSPFDYPGLSAQIKYGVMDADNLPDGTDPYGSVAVRYAQTVGDDFAFKINFSALQAQDWVADNYTTDRNLLAAAAENPNIDPESNVGAPNFDGMNQYGDETQILVPFSAFANSLRAPVVGGLVANGVPQPLAEGYYDQNIGLLNPIQITRTGIEEQMLLDNRDASSFKADAALHYRAAENVEIIANYRFGAGSTIYQGSERYALRNFIQEFAKLEVRGSNYFVRGYGSFTNAGDSYNLTALGGFTNELFSPSQAQWVPEYLATYTATVLGAGLQAGTTVDNLPAGAFSQAHNSARMFADRNIPAPGSPEFQQAVENVRSRTFQNGGASFFDDSNLWHAEFNYDFAPLLNDVVSIQVGGNYRQYDLFTDGTVFNEDPDGDGVNERIQIEEVGAYVQLSKKMFDDRLKATGSLRYDKNENFDGQVTPRVSLVYSLDDQGNHNIRASYQTGFRNPTTQGQFIFFPTTNTIIGGTRANAERYGLYERGSWTLNSYNQFVGALLAGTPPEDAQQLLVDANATYVQPEQLTSYELGYKALIDRKLLLDIHGYYNTYRDFIGEQLVVNKDVVVHQGQVYAGNTTDTRRTFSLYTNFDEDITSWGAALGITYRVSSKLDIFGNYSYADFDLDEEASDFNAGFNTPNNRFTIGVNARRIADRIGFGISYRWQEDFFYSSSFARGNVESFDVIDANISLRIPEMNSILKIGGSNLFDDGYVTNPGNPLIGQLYYVSLTFDQLMSNL